MSLPGPSKARTRSGRIALVGRPNVGKSTLLNALVGETLAITSGHPQTTREVVRGVLTDDDAQFIFLDTPGLHAAKTKLGGWMNEAARSAAHDADAVVLVVEAPRDGRGALDERDAEIAGEMASLTHVVVAISKIDRLKDKASLLPLAAHVAERYGLRTVVPVSARRRDGTKALLGELRLLLPEQPFFYDADTLSDQPVRFFVAELVREQVLKQVRQEVPHGVAVVVDRFDESAAVVQIEATVHVAREAHKKILVGARGQMMKTIGSAARLRVEALLSRRVHLRLWVRATPKWMDDESKLRELGYTKAEAS